MVPFFIYALCQATTLSLALPYYPLYAIDSGRTKLEKRDYEIIATNFSYIQGSYDTEQLQAFKQANPEFAPVSYINSGIANAMELEMAGRMNVAFYWAGNLTDSLSSTDTKFRMHLAPAVSPLKASNVIGNVSTKDGYVTFLRFGDEIVKIVDVTDNGSFVTVARGFDGSQAMSYKAGVSVFAPVYNSEGFPGGTDEIRYTVNPMQQFAVDRLVNHTLEVVSSGYKGSWFDLFSDHQYDAVDMGGKRLKATWDFTSNAYYTEQSLLAVQKERLEKVWSMVNKKLGYYPTILANNVASCYSRGNASGECSQLLEKMQTFRPLDGYCLEQFCGMEQNGNSYQSGCDPTKLSFNWVPTQEWIKHVQIVMDAAQRNLAVFPMVAQAGCKSVKLEMMGSLRDKFENFAYASYLLAVEDPSGVTRLGIPAFYQSGGKRYAYVHPRYTWPIGKPSKTVPAVRIMEYQAHGHKSFVRPFTGGMVVVNPYNQTDTQIYLDGSYYDPVSQTMVDALTSKAQTGYILLKKKVD